MKIKSRSHIYDINLGTGKNRPRSRYEHKYGQCKKCLGMMIPISY